MKENVTMTSFYCFIVFLKCRELNICMQVVTIEAATKILMMFKNFDLVLTYPKLLIR